MLWVQDIIDKCRDNKQQVRAVDDIDTIAVHRCGIDLVSNSVLGYDGLSVAEAFVTGPAAPYTNGQLAYSILIGGDLGPAHLDGVVWQCAPLDEVTWHARRFSIKALGIGLIGDPRYRTPSHKQINALHDLLTMVCLGWSLDPYKAIKGHGEIDGAHDGSKAPGEASACPGDKLDMHAVRDDVHTLMRYSGRRGLHDAGLVFSRPGPDGPHDRRL